MLELVVGGRLERMSEKKDLRVAEELAREMIERLVGSERRELLDPVPFLSARDLERKLLHFRDNATEIEFMRRCAARRPPAKPLISVAG